MSSADSDDPRDDRTVRDDYMADRVMELSAAVKALTAIVAEAHQQPTHVQKVIHKTEGSTFASIVAACVSACCVVILVVVTIFVAAELHDLRAWKDVHSNDIAKLKADVSQLETKIKRDEP